MMFRTRKILSLSFDEMCKVQILEKLKSDIRSIIESGKQQECKKGWKGAGRERGEADRLRRIHKYAVDWKGKVGTELP
jgi:hypothetical protein